MLFGDASVEAGANKRDLFLRFSLFGHHPSEAYGPSSVLLKTFKQGPIAEDYLLRTREVLK